VLSCSGRDDTIDLDEVVAANVDEFILKPFDLTELAETVDRLLEKAALTG
jgi:DNA-binding response OmpR family regulator